MNVLVVADQSNGAITDLTFELLSAGARLGSTAVLVVAKEPDQATKSLSREGVAEIIQVAVDDAEFDIDLHRHVLEQAILLRRPDVTLLPSSVNGRTVGAAVAAKLGLNFASDVHCLEVIDDQLVAERHFYSESAIGELEFAPESGTLVLLRPGSWAPASGTSSPRVSSISVPAIASRTRHLEYLSPATDDETDVAQADVILAVGRGIGSHENVAIMQHLADRMGAVLVGSRPVIDAGWLPANRLVGQSGASVAPRVYIAFGLSGAVQHVSGMNRSSTIVAVNRDRAAGIFEVAHYGAVMDMFAIVAELEGLYRA